MIQEFACPSCAAPLAFRSMQTVYLTCPSCRSVVVRHGTDVELIGNVSDLLDDMSVIQPQTKGHFQNRAFEVLGRLRVAWSDGFWNEWAVDQGGKICWLAEAQGNFVFYDRFDIVREFGTRTYNAGEVYRAPDGEPYEISDNKTARIVAIEGEVPHRYKMNEDYLSIDMIKNDERRGTLEMKGNENNFSYGFAQSAANFNFEYLRKIDGW